VLTGCHITALPVGSGFVFVIFFCETPVDASETSNKK